MPDEIPAAGVIKEAFKDSKSYLKENCKLDALTSCLENENEEAVFSHIRVGVCHILSSVFYGGIDSVIEGRGDEEIL